MTTQEQREPNTYLSIRHAVVARLEDDRATLAERLGGEKNAEAFVAAASEAIDGDPKIQACTPASITRALYTTATMGALPSGKTTPQNRREVALIPRGTTLTVMPEWRYFKRQFERHPDVRDTRPYLVHTVDTYEWDPIEEKVSHHYDPFRAERTWPDDGSTLVGAYLRIWRADGTFWDFPVTRDHILKARDAQGGPVWKGAWFPEMCLKTVYRKAASADVITFDPMSDVGRQIGAAMHADVQERERPSVPEITQATSPADMVTPGLGHRQEPATADTTPAPEPAPSKAKPRDTPKQSQAAQGMTAEEKAEIEAAEAAEAEQLGLP